MGNTLLVQHKTGSTHDKGASPCRHAAGALAPRVKGNNAKWRLSPLDANLVGMGEKRLRRVVGIALGRAYHLSKGPVDLGHRVAGRCVYLRDLHATGGDGTRLVKAQGVDARERLHAIGLLHEYLARGQARGSDGKNARGEKHQSLRNHPHHCSNCREDGVIQSRAVHEERAQEKPNSQRKERIGAQANDGTKRIENLRVHGLDVFGLGIDTSGIAFLPHLGHAGEKVSGVHEASA